MDQSIQVVDGSAEVAESVETLQDTEDTIMPDSSIPTYQQAREAAGLPEVVDLESIIGKPITVLQWDPATRRLPETGMESEGFEMLFEQHSDGETRMAFVGAVVLVKELKALAPPFSTTIVKDNRTYKFS